MCVPPQVARIQELVARYRQSAVLELQQRSVEYSRMFSFDAIRAQLLERMPALDEATYARQLADPDKADAGAGPGDLFSPGD